MEINHKVPLILELACLLAFLAELGHERAAIIITREYLYLTIAGVGDEHEASMMVEHQASRKAIILALLGAERELDSSHLFHLHLTDNDKEMLQTAQAKEMKI